MQTRPLTHSLWRALLLLSALALLRYAGLESLDTTGVMILAGLLAIPIAAYRAEFRLFSRRAVLGEGLREGSPLRRWLWQGSLIRLSSYLGAFILSLLIMVAAGSLTDGEWLIVAAATAGLILLEAASGEFARRQAREDFLPIFQRGLVKWPTLAALVGACALLAFYTPHPNYIDRDIVALTEQAFDTQLARFASPLLGYLHALLSWTDTVLMYTAQNYLPRIDSPPAQWLLWIYVAIKSSISSALVIYLLLGLLTLDSVRARRGWRLLGRSVFEKTFTLTFLLLFLVYLYASRITLDPAITKPAPGSADCATALQALRDFDRERRAVLGGEEQALQRALQTQIDSGLDGIFASAEAGVDAYLDWYFSVLGEYQRLGAAMLGDFSPGAGEQLDRLVLDGINRQLASLNLTLAGRLTTALEASAQHPGMRLPGELQAGDCLSGFEVSAPGLAGAPVLVGQPQAVVTGGAIAAIGAKKAAAKAGAKGAGKVAGKYGASLAGGLTAAALCGPLAAACGIGAGIATWVAVDAAIVTADEMLHRDALRAEILEELARQQQLLAAEMASLYRSAVAAGYDSLEDSFVIPDDGF